MYLQVIAVGLFTAAVMFGAVAVVARIRIEVGPVDGFSMISGGLALASAILALGFYVADWLVVVLTTVVVCMVIPVIWFRFAVEYVGSTELVTARNMVLIGVPVFLGLLATVVVYGPQIIPGFVFPSQAEASTMMAVGLTAINLLQWFGLLYAGGLLLAGCGVLLWAYQRYPHLHSTTGILLGTFGILPWLSLFFGLQLEGISMIAFGGTSVVGMNVGAIAALGLIGPYPLFERVPSVGTIGPRTVLEELDDPVIVTDRSGRIIEINPAAQATFAPGEPGIGSSIDSFLGVPIDALDPIDVTDLETTDGRVLFSTTVSTLTGPHGTVLGYTVILRDMTDQSTRRQLLEVFHRILRHNLRNDMTVILGHLDEIERQGASGSIDPNIEAIQSRGSALLALSEKAREAERVLTLESTDNELTPLAPLVEQIFEQFRATSSATLRYESDGEYAISAPAELLNLIIENLVSNAIRHHDAADPWVTVTVSETQHQTYPAEIRVEDDGPGLPSDELAVMRAGSESPLVHGSGIGLWIVRLAVTKLGGTISFRDRDPRGTAVVIRLPTALGSSTPTD